MSLLTTELILLLVLFVFLFMGKIVQLPKQAIDEAGPHLGARVERHLMTGEGFVSSSGQDVNWELPASRNVPGFGETQ